jgi:hypothetical protein
MRPNRSLMRHVERLEVAMKRALTTVIALVTAGVATTSPALAQGGAQPWNDCVATEIQERLVAQQRIRLSAQSISLDGDTLRLTGNARVRFEQTAVIAEEIVINQSTKRVEFTGVRQIYIGSGSRCAPPPSAVPKIEFR